MSDRLTNLEIEDVLSSIRRLVSQEARPSLDDAADAPAPRLLLTSELRVQRGRETAPIPDPRTETTAEPLFLQDRAVEIEGLLSSHDAEFEPETGEPVLPSSVIGWPGQTRPDPLEAVAEAPFIDADATLLIETPHQPPLHAVPEEDDPQGPPALLDEATLREIVRDVLREELAGPMGQRVTRNLRRLIRTEIARAFAQDHPN